MAQLEKALQLCQEIQREFPDFTDVLYLQGLVLYQLRRPAEAIRLFRTVVGRKQRKASATQVEAGLALAVLLAEVGDLGEANREAELALRHDPHHELGMHLHALIRLRLAPQSNDPDAQLHAASAELETLLKAMEVSSTEAGLKASALAAFAWSQCLLSESLSNDQLQVRLDAIAHLRRATSIEPSDPLPHIFRGCALMMLEQSSTPTEYAHLRREEAEKAFTAVHTP